MLMKISFLKWLKTAAILMLVLTLGSTGYAAKTYKLLIIDSQKGPPYEGAREAMIRQLSSFGFSERKNLIISHFSIGNDVDKAEKILRQELPKKYDVIFSNGTVATLAAKKVAFGNTANLFVFAAVTDPVGLGVIDDFKNPPKANFTGVCYPVPVNSRLKFVRDMLPKAKTIGLIYSDMPQGHSYRKWVEAALLEDPALKGLRVIFRMVPLIKGDYRSQQMMAELAQKYILELDPMVDVFLGPNDQLGAERPFYETVYKTANKPIVGTTRNSVMEKWGATMTIYPSEYSEGRQCAYMIKKIFNGEDIKTIIPQWPKENGIAVDLRKAKQYRISVPIQIMEMAGEDIIR
jgi:putative tryptophan/tyrosine transport system substrate-binding protein